MSDKRYIMWCPLCFEDMNKLILVPSKPVDRRCKCGNMMRIKEIRAVLEPSKREIEVIRLRDIEHLTFRKIGELIGKCPIFYGDGRPFSNPAEPVSANRARQIYQQAKFRERLKQGEYRAPCNYE